MQASMFSTLVILYLILPFTPPAFSNRCHEHEGSALLQFRDSFLFDYLWCTFPYVVDYYPTVETWNLSTPDCCQWEGVECDRETNHVINLELSCANGSIYSNSSLFHLVHLQSLNLANNHFNYREIPPEIGNFSSLTHLNLSNSRLSGHIPIQLYNLSALVSLDLSRTSLEPSLKDVVRGFTNLKLLHLDDANISSSIPYDLFSQLSSLEFLSLDSCNLQGEFPVAIFNLPNLRVLNVQGNSDLKGNFPVFQSGSRLKSLRLRDTGFSGVIPPSVGNLVYLEEFDIYGCNFTGKIPSSVGNLTRLAHVDMFDNQLFGPIPPTLWNLTRLEYVKLSSNQLSGQFPFQINQLPSLRELHLSWNYLEGSIPASFSNLSNLEVLDLRSNNLSGRVDLNVFLQSTSMTKLILSFNKLTLLSRIGTNPANITKLEYVGLASCHLTEFPSFLRNQHQLMSLDLSSNNMYGKIPKLSTKSLGYLNLSLNRLTGFEQDSPLLQWKDIGKIDLSFNMLQGPLPVAPPSTDAYFISHNNLSGQISPSFCNLNLLYSLDLSFNSLSGNIPQCLPTLSGNLFWLNLQGNKLDGGIPSNWNKKCELVMLSISYNQLEGQIPNSLAHCSSLQLIDFSHNRLSDSLPSWVGSLTKLQILLLRSNHFYGGISQATTAGFQNLRIIDLAYNNFSGQLNSFYFQNWNAMETVNESHRMAYLTPPQSALFFYGLASRSDYYYSIIMYVKGLATNYAKIPDILTTIDFSNNRFEGEIPEVIGNLKALYGLNLSNNHLQGKIPSSLSNLMNLEGLDLSNNRLSGEIPWQLTKINTLSSFNVSFNDLSGRIPQGQQFCTFDDTSFEGNPRLKADRSRSLCGNYRTMPVPVPSSSVKDVDPESGFEWNWMIIVMGFFSGVIVGVVAGNEFVIRKRNWLRKVVPRKKQARRRRNRN